MFGLSPDARAVDLEILHQARRDEDAIRIAEFHVAMADGAIAEIDDETLIMADIGRKALKFETS